MIYELIFTTQAKTQIERLKKSEVAAFTKLKKLLEELIEHPYTGTGKPEKVKYDLTGHYSRRITKKHRLIYTVDDKKVLVEVINVFGHYGDK